jgi:hypothetical protein
MFLARGLCYLISINSITIDEPLFVAMSQTQLDRRLFISPSVVIALVVLARPSGGALHAVRPRHLRHRRQRARR